MSFALAFFTNFVVTRAFFSIYFLASTSPGNLIIWTLGFSVVSLFRLVLNFGFLVKSSVHLHYQSDYYGIFFLIFESICELMILGLLNFTTHASKYHIDGWSIQYPKYILGSTICPNDYGPKETLLMIGLLSWILSSTFEHCGRFMIFNLFIFYFSYFGWLFQVLRLRSLLFQFTWKDKGKK